MVRTLAVAVLLCLSAALAAGQSADAKKRELQRLRQSIERTQQQIDDLTRQERSQRKNLSSYQRQRHELTVFIHRLEDDLARLKDSATLLRGQIQNTEQALAEAERSYSNAAVSLMKYRTKRKGIPEESLTTDAVFQRLSRALAEYRRRMIRLRDSLTAEQQLLDAYSVTQDSVLSTKAREQRLLSSTIARSSTELQKIRSDKGALARQLEQKRKSVAQMRRMIERLVAEERRKAEDRRRKADAARKRSGTAGKPPAPSSSSSVKGFARNSLPWPTGSKSILHGYGNYRNPETGTTLDNPGIDIKASTGTTVKAVADGTVSSVKWLPGFNTLVIVDHGNGVRTVYANLATVNVSAGSGVRTGSTIGTTGENIDGELLHFEIWNGRERQNPLTYLR